MTYCGLCSPDSHGYIGTIADIARDFRKVMRCAQYEKIAAAIADAPFGKPFGLPGAMVKIRCKKGVP